MFEFLHLSTYYSDDVFLLCEGNGLLPPCHGERGEEGLRHGLLPHTDRLGQLR